MTNPIKSNTDSETEAAAFRLFLDGHDVRSEEKYLQLLQEQLANTSDSLEVAATHQSLGQLYLAQGNYDLADTHLQRAISLHSDRNDLDGTSAGSCYIQLAQLREVQGKFSLADPLFFKGIELCERDLGSDHEALPQLCLEAYYRFLIHAGREDDASRLMARIERLRNSAAN